MGLHHVRGLPVSASCRRRLRLWRRKIAFGSFARDVNFSIEMDGFAIDVLEDRVSALEEIIAARGRRRRVLCRRLARQLRASDDRFAWAGPTFAARRGEAMTEDIHYRMTPRRRRSR